MEKVAIVQLCQPVAETTVCQRAWTTMGHRATWLSHTSVPDPDMVGLVQGRLATNGMPGLWFTGSSPTSSQSVNSFHVYILTIY